MTLVTCSKSQGQDQNSVASPLVSIPTTRQNQKPQDHITCQAMATQISAAFGEIGLDYDRLNHSSKEVQIRTLKKQLDLFVSSKWDLPLFLHCRASFQDFVNIITPYLPHLPRRGLVHWFVGSKAEILPIVGMGFHVSINRFSFQGEESLEMIKAMPLENLQIETDAPWGVIASSSDLAKRCPFPVAVLPSKKRDKFQLGRIIKDRNDSCTIGQVAAIVAGLRGISTDTIAETTWKNSTEMCWPIN